jgi:hypothetical protein
VPKVGQSATITAMGLRTEDGNQISKQSLAKILRNPIYWISYKPGYR